MHRDYRVYGTVQIIRYSNRIEISNPGYSLKPLERLGEPGSETRNPNIASVFHETRLAENKGTGVRAMRQLMKEAELVPPSFESDRRTNRFTTRLVLHHFLSAEDLAWLTALGEPGLSGEEKLVLVWVREVGAVDNATFRDLTGAETLKASAALRHLCDLDLLEKKGQGSATYYVPTDRLLAAGGRMAGSDMVVVKPDMVDGKPTMVARKGTMVEAEASMVSGKPSMLPGKPSMPAAEPDMASGGTASEAEGHRQQAYQQLPEELQIIVDGIGAHADEASMRMAIQRLCAWRPHTAESLATLLRRNPDYLKTRYLKPMVSEKQLRLTIPEMPKHPNQAYTATEAGR
jgi:ATP-dependent DNA helicase RecG